MWWDIGNGLVFSYLLQNANCIFCNKIFDYEKCSFINSKYEVMEKKLPLFLSPTRYDPHPREFFFFNEIIFFPFSNFSVSQEKIGWLFLYILLPRREMRTRMIYGQLWWRTLRFFFPFHSLLAHSSNIGAGKHTNTIPTFFPLVS